MLYCVYYNQINSKLALIFLPTATNFVYFIQILFIWPRSRSVYLRVFKVLFRSVALVLKQLLSSYMAWINSQLVHLNKPIKVYDLPQCCYLFLYDLTKTTLNSFFIKYNNNSNFFVYFNGIYIYDFKRST